MLSLNDLYHVPPADDLINQVVADGPGLTVVAGFDPLSATLKGAAQGSPLPSGKAGLLRILMRQILTAYPLSRAIVVTDDRDSVHVPRNLARLVEVMERRPAESIAACVARATVRRPHLLVVDNLSEQTAGAALDAGCEGLRVLASMQTAMRGAGVARHLLTWGVRPEQLSGLSWVVTTQRMPALCPICRQGDPLDEERTAFYRHSFHEFDAQAGYYRVSQTGCEDCGRSGRKGDISVFDFFHAVELAPRLFYTPSVLTMSQYALALAAQGHLAIDDALGAEVEQYGRLQQLLDLAERAASQNDSTLRRKLLELQASNRVLQQRTEALISLEKLGGDLISSVDLQDIGSSVCRYAGTLCGAGRAILYVLRPGDGTEVLAATGWHHNPKGMRLPASEVFGGEYDRDAERAEPVPFNQWPPGVPPLEPDVEGARLYLGLRLPLVAQHRLVGLLIVYPTTKPRFNPGEAALLRTLADQAALAMQRAELVEDLRAKITQLETAQAELVMKERLERELELARQVQESLLPRKFPTYPGYAFAARCVPARQVGGDFYDVFRLDEYRFGVVVADVSDKGMPAALFMALTRSLLLAEAEREVSPRAVLSNVNRLLLALATSEMFVTVFYGVVDTRRGTLTYARAGHDRPLLLRSGAAEIQDLVGQGTVLGQLPSDALQLTEEQVSLVPGDRLVLYTDGLYDVQNARGESYGREGLVRLLQAAAHRDVLEWSVSIFTALNAFRGSTEQFDDMTMLVVEVG